MTMEVQSDFEFSEQQENLERVTSRIERAIVEFCRAHKRFHADELRAWVVQQTGIAAPASADRILRDLRQRGVIGYVVLSRRESLYEVNEVTERSDGQGNDQTPIHGN